MRVGDALGLACKVLAPGTGRVCRSALYLFLNFILERFYPACGILRAMTEESLQFHIEAKDYFGTLATVLDLVGQDLQKKGQHRNAETLLRQREGLMQLQQGYRIEKIPADSQCSAD